MNLFYNVMETLVAEKLDEIWGDTNSCKCNKCRNDIMAYTLNQLSPKYVVSREGELYVRLHELSSRHHFEIVIALTKSIKLIEENPKHIQE
jgi:competence protein ComFB